MGRYGRELGARHEVQDGPSGKWADFGVEVNLVNWQTICWKNWEKKPKKNNAAFYQFTPKQKRLGEYPNNLPSRYIWDV